MNSRNGSGLGGILRQLVQECADAIQRLINRRTTGQNTNYRYSDPDIIDMPQPPVLYERKTGQKILGVILAAAGFFYGGLISLVSLVPSIVSILFGEAGMALLAMGLGMPFVLFFFGIGFLGVSKVKRVNRFQKYIQQIGNDELCNIKDLADRTGKSQKYVTKDVEKMIQNGWFCQGHLNTEKTCLMLTDDMYREYQKLEREKEQIRLEEERKREEMEKEERLKRTRRGPIWNTGSSEHRNSERRAPEKGGFGWKSGKRRDVKDLYGKKTAEKEERWTNLPADVQKIMEQGAEYIQKIQQCNDEIPGEEISAKMEQMEQLLNKIFERVEQKPESVGAIRRLMEYYLPTTIKLLETYAEIDDHPFGGENIQTAKKEIEDSLDTINASLVKLLDSMYQETAWDVSSDISVLKTMLAQEGLGDDGWKKS